MAGLGLDQEARCANFSGSTRRFPLEHLKRAGGPAWIEIDSNPITRESIALDPWPITLRPENFVFIVAGGGASDQQLLAAGLRPARHRPQIRVPETFDRCSPKPTAIWPRAELNEHK